MHFATWIVLIATTFIWAACDDEKDEPQKELVLSVDKETIQFEATAQNATLTVTMSGPGWTASSSQPWCNISKRSSSTETTLLTVGVPANPSTEARTAMITFVMESKTATVTVTQQGKEGEEEPDPWNFPDYSNYQTPDQTGMEKNALELAAEMKAGWNLGNSLEVPGNETGWGNPKTTKAFIDKVKASGINAIRIPCSWNSYIENTNTWKLKESWLARVKEVVDYCYENDMYVTINGHWDGGWLENNPTAAKKDEVNAKQKAIWQQIGQYFRDYDERLLFAGTNEVHVDGTPTQENFEVQISFNQTFVDAVRSTGGRNHYRNLIIQAYNTNIDHAVSNLQIPEDVLDDRLMVEVHYYDPWDFCGLEEDASWATVKIFWGEPFAQYGEISDWGQEDFLVGQFGKMKTKFVDKGYPVILGEFGAIKRTSLIGETLQRHLESRAYFFKTVAREAKDHGLVPFFWDNGSGFFDRTTGAITDQPGLDAYLEGTEEGEYPF